MSFNWRHTRSFADCPTVYIPESCDVEVYYDRKDAAFGVSLEGAAELGYFQFTRGRAAVFGREAHLEIKIYSPKIRLIVLPKKSN